MTTVCCLWVRGEYPYTADYVMRLEAMVRRWMDRPFRFVCLTDQPEALPVIETIPVKSWSTCAAYWTKLEVFNRAHLWDGRVLYLDLDVLIVQSLAPILDYPAEFAITDDPISAHDTRPDGKRRTHDRFGRKIIRRFNSSVMVWDVEAQIPRELFFGWRPSDAERLSGDQDYIAEYAPTASAMPYAWFPRISQVGPPPFKPEVKVILSKFPKNHVLAEQFDWFRSLWGAA